MDNMPDEGKEYLIFVNDAALQLSEMVNGILEYSKSSQLFVDNIEIVNITTLIEEVKNLLNIPYEKSKGIPIRFVNKNVRKFAKILNIKI